jgi:hypothetical protein
MPVPNPLERSDDWRTQSSGKPEFPHPVVATTVHSLLPKEAQAGLALRGPKWARQSPNFFWRLIIRSGRGTHAELRHWARWVWWTSSENGGGARNAVRRVLSLAKLTLTETRVVVNRFGARVKATHGVGRKIQRRRILWLRWRHTMSLTAYYRFQLFRPERWARASQFLENGQAGDLLRVFYNRMAEADDDAILTDKRAFDVWCRQHGLPAVCHLMQFAAGRIVERNVDALPPCDLFSKPANSSGGHGACRWKYEEGGGAKAGYGEGGRLLTPEELIAHLESLSLETGFPILLQPCLRNHHSMASLTPGGLATVRVMTIRPLNGAPEPLLAVLRMPTGKTPADNFDLGGLAAAVDLSSGCLGPAVQKRGIHRRKPVDLHPNTNGMITGRQLPWWKETLALAVRGHAAVTMPAPVIGWDIAIVEDGPVFVETNRIPCSILAQIPTGVPLGATRYSQCVCAHLRAAFGM